MTFTKVSVFVGAVLVTCSLIFIPMYKYSEFPKIPRTYTDYLIKMSNDINGK